MKITLSQIRTAYQILADLSNKLFEPLTAYRIQKNIRALEPEFQEYEKARTALVKKHGDKTVNAQKQEEWSVPQGTKKWDAFQKEITPLLEEVIEINIVKIPLSAFSQITPANIAALEFMLDGLEDDSDKEQIKPPRKRK